MRDLQATVVLQPGLEGQWFWPVSVECRGVYSDWIGHVEALRRKAEPAIRKVVCDVCSLEMAVFRN